MPYEVIDHTADTGIRVWAPTLPDLFAEACRALFEQITDLKQITETHAQTICVEGVDRTDLLINWLRACLLEWTANQGLIQSAKIAEIRDTWLEARVFVQAFDPQKHPVFADIKAVTYHSANLSPTSDGWQGEVIFDV